MARQSGKRCCEIMMIYVHCKSIPCLSSVGKMPNSTNTVVIYNVYKKPGKIYCSTFRGHRDAIIKGLVKSYANKEKYKISTE